jgi:two-component system cell cycle sensor histidine kinase/response regulator CckA
MSQSVVEKGPDVHDSDAARLEAVARLAGGVAHDLNNALTIIFAHAAFLKRGGGTSPDWESDIDQITDAAQRASQLARQLLALGARQLLRPRQVDVNAIIRDLEPTLRKSAGHAVRVETRLAAGLPAIHADRAQLEQVVHNLALNAIEAMPSGGTLTISSRVAAADEFTGGAECLSPAIALTVADSGTGMDAFVVSKAFEPFFTTKPAGRGSGLGLSTVYGIIKQSGGTVTLDSTPGGGTAVTAYLPMAK